MAKTIKLKHKVKEATNQLGDFLPKKTETRDILTLVRELKILRDKNIALEEEVTMRRLINREHKEYMKHLYRMLVFIGFSTKSYNNVIATKAKDLIESYNLIRVKYNRKPFVFLEKKRKNKSEIKTGSYETCNYCQKDIDGEVCRNIDKAQNCKNI